MHLTDDDLVLHYYGEMSVGEEARASEHLAGCRTCQAGYGRLQRVLAAVDTARPEEPAEGFEHAMWTRVASALPGDRAPWRRLAVSPGWLAWAASIAVLVGMAFMAGREMRRPPAAATAGAVPVRERLLLVDLGDHLDRSQMMLVELVSTGESGQGPVDIAPERARAQQLLAANRLYRRTAASAGDTATAALLDDLERVLVDITAGPSTLSPEDLEAVRQRIQSDSLLFKVRVVSSTIHQRERGAIQHRAGI
ncbi:MAG TPA: hypothetical protein VFX12_06965 [Vicinamibacterales bacterium]|nr:hypothetical protein [Vicinamibacterales bacterium]